MTRPSNISALSAEALIEQKTNKQKKNKKNHKTKKKQTNKSITLSMNDT